MAPGPALPGAGDLKSLLTKTWCGPLVANIWTAYEPSLSFRTRLTVPEYPAASAAALALSAAAPVMIVPVPGRQFCGTWPDWGAWLGAAACAAFVVPDAPLLECELPIAKPPIATATTAAPAATNRSMWQWTPRAEGACAE
jgi:hypothetical protein